MPWKLIYQEKIDGRENARKREKFLKAGSGKEYLKKWLRSSAEYLPAGRQGTSE